MQRLSRELLNIFDRFGGQTLFWGFLPASVYLVSHESVAGIGQMNANLVGTACLQPTVDQGDGRWTTECLHDPGMCDSVSSPFKQCSLALAIMSVTGESRGNADNVAWLEPNASKPGVAALGTPKQNAR